jgi:uncharacterized membrane protein YcfT
MGRAMTANGTTDLPRIDWVDYAKGFCIVFVVMMHSTLGVEHTLGQEGWLGKVVAFARPFRMPDFFLISGLFLAQVIDRDWRTYLDRKVVHFVYFYLLWTAIQFAFKAPMFIHEHGPLSTVCVATKLAHSVRIPPLAVWLVGAALEIAHIHTGATVIDEFASRFVYFYTGYLFAPRIFAFAKEARERPETALAGLTIWGLLNGVLVFNGLGGLPFVSLVLGLLGAAAVVALAALMAKSDVFKPLRYCGKNSIVIYLAFFLPMAASRMVLLKTGWITDVGTISALVTLAGVLGALAWFWAVRATLLGFLFERPERFWIAPKKRLTLQPAE